jgi:glycogen debranching enzyme
VEDLIKVDERYYILATSSRAGERLLVLKHGETFAIFDAYGDIGPFGLGEQGLYHEGTRHLSRLDLRLDRQRPLLLSSTVKQENEVLTADLTNPDVVSEDVVMLPRDTLHVYRSKFLWNATCYERWRISNHGLVAGVFALDLIFEADFADIFEVRGIRRERRGERLPSRVTPDAVTLAYRGLDDVVRTTRLRFSEKPAEITDTFARFDLRLNPQEAFEFVVSIGCDHAVDPETYEHAYRLATMNLAAAKQQRCEIFSSNEQFNDLVNRSTADLHMMVTDTPQGPYPYAGIPWFSTAFGRDGIITALELLWAYPEIAKGVLQYLAANQASEVDPANDAEPGKILHETRNGEMAALREVPFGRYYGSVDATPLFVILAGAYYRRTADRDTIRRLWPHVERALSWIDRYGDVDADGFVEYERRSATGLVQQGWKDSSDSVFHQDGQLAEAPIALCEVQAYVYGAKRAASELAGLVGDHARARALAQESDRLREQFERAFWCDDLGTYALALDGHKRPCRVRASNAAQCLFTGIASPERARRIAAQVFDETLFSGWGIRTLATTELRYNPMSYHNGSVWPHDNALIAAGLARYGFTDLAARLLGGLLDASLFMDLRRMPELFCGFPRRAGEGPTRYPVACIPQAWAAGAVFLMLQACLGLSIDAPARRLSFSGAVLPPFLRRVRLEHLAIGEDCVDLQLERHPHDVGVSVLERAEGVEIVSIK